MNLLKIRRFLPRALYLQCRQFQKKCQQDEIGLVSAYLAFVSILSFVPLLTITLSLLSQLPFFHRWQDQIEVFIFKAFVPNTGEAIRQHLSEFLNNVSHMSNISAFALLVAVMMMFRTIDHEINRIFKPRHKKVKRLKRTLLKSLPLYFSVIILGPIMIGASLVTTTAVLALDILRKLNDVIPLESINSLLPVILSFIYFCFLYLFLPNRKVRASSAMIGALFASVAFEVSKYLFSLYLVWVPTYQMLYGSLAVLPILCIWIYIVWWIVLLGAEITSFREQRL